MPSVLTICGSLRRDSIHNRLLTVAESELDRLGVTNRRLDSLRDLPRFNEDLDTDIHRPPTATDLLADVAAADAILLATPTYNGSMPSGIKDLIDWCSRPIGNGVIRGRKFGLITASPGPRGGGAGLEYLQRALPALGATLIKPAVSLPQVHTNFDSDGTLAKTTTGLILDIARAVALTSKGAEVANEPDQQRFEIRIGGPSPTLLGFAEYRTVGDRVDLPHTVTKPEFGGQGVASFLIREVLDRLRTDGKSVIASCSFVAKFIHDNPEYQSLE